MPIELSEAEKLQRMMHKVYAEYEAGHDRLSAGELADLTRSFALLSLARSGLARPLSAGSVASSPVPTPAPWFEGPGHPHF